MTSGPGATTSDLSEAGLRYDLDGPVATISLSRPEIHNAQSPLMWAALRELGGTLPDTVRVVVVRADGPSFSSGLDRRMLTPAGLPGEPSLFGQAMADQGAAGQAIAGRASDVKATTGGPAAVDDDRLEVLLTGYQEAFSWLRTTSAVTIAAVHGHAIGAGFQLALACDLRVLADDTRFAMRETSLGLVPDLGGTQPLVEAVGYARALEICVSGRDLDADEAAQLGLATIVVTRDDLDATVTDLADAILAAPFRAVIATKQLLRGAAHRTYAEQLGAERTAQAARIRDLVGGSAGNNQRPPGVAVPDE